MNPSQLKTTPVSDLMLPVSVLSPLDPTSKVVGIMRKYNQYEAFIEEADRTAVVSIRDVLNVKDISTTKLRTLMYYVPRLNQFNTVGDAATLMFEHRLRSLPIYQASKLKGQITSKSIVEKLFETERGIKASQIMTPNPICLEAGQYVSKARQIMIRRKIDQLPVLKEGRLLGAVTSEAVVSVILPPVDRTMAGDWRKGRYDIPVEDFIKPGIVVNEATDSSQSVLENMGRGGSNFSVIQNFDEIQGIVTYRDFLKLLLKPREAEQAPNMYIIGLPEDPFEAEAARQKFQRVVQLLWRGLPEMTEARAIIKAGKTKAPRKKYQVKLFVMSPYWRHSYSVFRYELPDAFDYIEDWAAKLLSQHQKRKDRSRARSDSGLVQEKEQMPNRRRMRGLR